MVRKKKSFIDVKYIHWRKKNCAIGERKKDNEKDNEIRNTFKNARHIREEKRGKNGKYIVIKPWE